MRVVSLVPSLTESAMGLGVTPVACTRFCEQPTLPHVGGTKNPDLAAIVALQPDLVLLDREENRREDAEALAAGGLALHVTDVRDVDDIGPMLVALAAALGVTPDSGSIPQPHGGTPREAVVGERRAAFIPIWRRPWMTVAAGTYGSSLLAAVGIDNVFADHPDPYPTVTLEEVAVRSPALVLLPSEPYSFAPRHVDELREALPTAVVLHVDGQDLFWWGIRTEHAIERLSRSIAQTVGPSSP